MKSKIIAASFVTLLGFANLAAANSNVPAWQEPGFVMEEVVATAPRVADAPALAWQEPGYVMEEVVATAQQIEIPEAQVRTRSHLPRYRLATPMRPLIRRLTSELVRRAGQLDVQFDPLTVAP